MQLASTMRSIASAVPPPAAASTDEAAAKAAYLARLDAEPPFYTKKQVVAGATLASTMRSIASMASAMPLPAATITDEAAAKAAYLARMEAESPFYTKKQGVAGAALASTMHSMASADIEGCCGSTLHLGRTCPARLRRRSAVFSHARASHSAFRGWRNAKCWGAPLSAGGRSFAPSSAVVGHKTQTRLGPSVHWFSGRAVERAVGYNASGPVPLHRPPLPLRPVGASLSSKVNRQDKTRQDLAIVACLLLGRG